MFHCRADLNKMMMSMSVGPYCDINQVILKYVFYPVKIRYLIQFFFLQDVDSKDWRTGAVVAIKMDENERECKYCFSLSKATVFTKYKEEY